LLRGVHVSQSELGVVSQAGLCPGHLDPETSYLKQVIQPEFEAAPSSITSNLLSALMAHQAGGRKGFASC
jgi:hypothetical protein